MKKASSREGKGSGHTPLNRSLINDWLIQYNTTLFYYMYASHTQQKLVSRWGVGKHITLQYIYAFKIWDQCDPVTLCLKSDNGAFSTSTSNFPGQIQSTTIDTSYKSILTSLKKIWKMIWVKCYTRLCSHPHPTHPSLNPGDIYAVHMSLNYRLCSLLKNVSI